jgi:hypothetical protein
VADATFEQLWKRLQLYAPDLPTPLAQEFINTAYSIALTWDRWRELRQEFEYSLPAIYTDGSVDVTNGSATVTGNGTAWTTSMIYRQFMVNGITPMFTIINVDDGAQTLTLDRPFNGIQDGPALPYEIGQYYLDVPTDFLTWDIVRDVDRNWKLHTNFQQRQIDVWDTKRTTTGTPWVVAAAPSRFTYLNGVATTAAPIQRYEFWPRPQPFSGDSGHYACRYIRRPPLLSNPDDRPIRPLRGDVIRKGALAELALWPGTKTAENPYYNLQNHAQMVKEFERNLSDCWKDDQEGAQTAILYEDWEGIPYAPIDARYLQSHDVF